MKNLRISVILLILSAVPYASAQTDDLFSSSGLVPAAGRQTDLSFSAGGAKDVLSARLKEELTLENCIDIALSNSPRAVAAELAVQDAQVSLNLARSEFFPTATAGASQNYNNQKTDGFPRRDYGTSDVYAQAQLSLSGITDIARNVKISKLTLEQAQTDLRGVKTKLREA